MSRSYRALRPEFRQHLTEMAAWPKEEALKSWFKQHHDGLRNGRYSALRSGQAVAEKYSRGLIQYLLQESAIPELSRRRDAVLAFLEVQASGASEEVLDRLCDPPLTHPTPAPNRLYDAIIRGPRFLFDLFDVKRAIRRFVRHCRTQSEVQIAVRWVFICVGRAWDGDHLSIESAITAAESKMGVTVADYTQHALLRWRHCPWTVIFAMGERRPVGMCMMLPLCHDAYERIRRGDMQSWKALPEDLLVPTPTLFVEALAERPREDGADCGNPTHPLFIAELAQVAYLASSTALSGPGAFRMMSPSGTPTNMERAKAWGFRPVGHRLCGTDVELVERTYAAPQRTWRDVAILGLLSWLHGHLHRHEAPLLSGEETAEHHARAAG